MICNGNYNKYYAEPNNGNMKYASACMKMYCIAIGIGHLQKQNRHRALTH